MRLRLFALVLPLVPLVAPTTHADTLLATRRMPMFEAAHTVDIAVKDGVATYTVRRMFSNPGKTADQVELRLDLPYGAAATGLRIRANDTWYDGVLMERDKAAALYQEMTGFGSAAAKDPALLAWLWADKLSLQVFPVLPGTVSTVEYTLTVPTRYENGRYFVSYPRSTSGTQDGDALPLATPVVTVRPAWGNARTPIVVDGRRVARNTPVVLLPPVREAWADAVGAQDDASYVASKLDVEATAPTNKTYAKASVAFHIAHTYKSDLAVDLVTPSGERVSLHDKSGGGDNDLSGTFAAVLPPDTKAAGTWRLVVSDHAALDTGSLDRWSLTFGEGKTAITVSAKDTPVFVPDAPESASDAGVATISIAPPAIATWQARLGRAVASSKRAFSRLEIDVAPQLVPLPKKAQVVFVVDASHSASEDGLRAQLDVIAAYMAHVPDADVEIVAYRRHASRVFGRFVAARDFRDAFAVAKARGAFAPGNGSALEEGARAAAAALVDRRGPRRMVIMTDEMTRTALTPVIAQAALAKLPADAIVHVVVPKPDGSDRPALHRRDDAPFAPLATRHHGIYVDVEGLPAATLKSLIPVALELVRPTRIENVAVPGFVLDTNTLHEGDGLRLMHDVPDAPRTLTITGYLWSDPIKKTLTANPTFSIQTAGFVFGGDMHHSLTEAEQYTLAMYGKAVSPVTSYVAWEPGARPSVIGLGEGWGTIGSGRYGTLGHGSGGGGYGRITPDFTRLIDVQSCVKAVQPKGAWSVTLDIETTVHEIVDVVTATTKDAMATCLVENTWSLALDRAQFPFAREQFRVELSGS
ncbi:MAG: proprotein convertase P-domain-containing protein [Kofleriaceae bacterium]